MVALPRERSATLLAFAVVVGLFFLNDLAFIAADTVGEWLAADYLFKVAALVLIAFLVPLRRAVTDRPLAVSLSEAALLTLLASAFAVTVFDGAYDLIDDLIPGTALQDFPEITTPALYWFDMTVGLALTAISEELVFRRLFLSALRPLFASTAVFVVVSALVFGAIHWSSGIANVVCATLAGIAFMLLLLRTGSIWPAVVAHYLVNFILFYDPP